MSTSRSAKHKRRSIICKESLTLSRATGNRGAEGLALYQLARVERGRGNLDLASNQMAEALDVIESLRGRVPGWQFRATYLATAQDYYEFQIDLLMQLHKQTPFEGHDAAALETSERSIARSLLESLSEAGADIRGGVDASLLERERALKEQLSARSTQPQTTANTKEIEALIAQYQEVEAQIRANSPRYAALTQPVPLKLKEIQQQALDNDTLLLEYAIGKERSYLWAVTSSSIASYELPKRAEIEVAIRRVYESFSIGSSGNTASRAALSRMLLGPVAGQLGTKRLLIVATGALQYLPFSALPLPGTEERPTYRRPRNRESPLGINPGCVAAGDEWKISGRAEDRCAGGPCL